VVSHKEYFYYSSGMELGSVSYLAVDLKVSINLPLLWLMTARLSSDVEGAYPWEHPSFWQAQEDSWTGNIAWLFVLKKKSSLGSYRMTPLHLHFCRLAVPHRRTRSKLRFED